MPRIREGDYHSEWKLRFGEHRGRRHVQTERRKFEETFVSNPDVSYVSGIPKQCDWLTALHLGDCCTCLLPEMKTLSLPGIYGIMSVMLQWSMFSFRVVGDGNARWLSELLRRFMHSLRVRPTEPRSKGLSYMNLTAHHSTDNTPCVHIPYT